MSQISTQSVEYFSICFVSFIWPKITIGSVKKEGMIYMRMLLQKNGAATKVQEGKIFQFPQYLFTWTGFGFPIHDEDKEEDEEDGEEVEEEEKQDEGKEEEELKEEKEEKYEEVEKKKKEEKERWKRKRMRRNRRHRKGKIYLLKTFTTRTFLLTFFVCHISASVSISIENQRYSNCH